MVHVDGSRLDAQRYVVEYADDGNLIVVVVAAVVADEFVVSVAVVVVVIAVEVVVVDQVVVSAIETGTAGFVYCDFESLHAVDAKVQAMVEPFLVMLL